MLYLLKRKITRLISRFLERKARRNIQKHSELWNYLSRVSSSSTGCSYGDYWVLYSYILRKKPREVLELGSGVSTVVMGYALLKNGSGRITSMEESAEYAEQTRKLLPEEMKKLIEVVHSPSIEKRWGPFVGRGYRDIPEKSYDFVFVDGPHYDRETSFDVDLLELVQKSETPLTAVIDSRAGSCIVYNLYLKPKFYFDYFQNIGYLKDATKKDLASYHRVITRELGDHSVKRTLLL